MKKRIFWGILAILLSAFVGILIQNFSGSLYNETLVKVDTIEFQENQQILNGTYLNGEEKGQKIALNVDFQNNEAVQPRFKKGNQVFIANGQVVEKKRDGFVVFLLALLLSSLLLIGGKMGFTTFISVILNSIGLYGMVWIYRQNPQFQLVPITMIYMIFATGITLFLIDGIQKNSLQKFLATIVTILLAYFICFIVMLIGNDRGLRFEDMGILTRPYRSIFLSSLLIGTIGATLDTVVTVISTLEEIELQNKQITLNQLLESGRRVGEDISGTMINVLVCSYLSSSIPLFLLYLFNGWSFFHSANMLLSLELVRILCGGFGILFSIPVSLGFFYLRRRKQ